MNVQELYNIIRKQYGPQEMPVYFTNNIESDDDTGEFIDVHRVTEAKVELLYGFDGFESFKEINLLLICKEDWPGHSEDKPINLLQLRNKIRTLPHKEEIEVYYIDNPLTDDNGNYAQCEPVTDASTEYTHETPSGRRFIVMNQLDW